MRSLLPLALSASLVAAFDSAYDSSYDSKIFASIWAGNPSTLHSNADHPISAGNHSKYPTVELPYAKHLATTENKDGGYITYKNIRYGQAPIGEKRWQIPVPPVAVQKDRPTYNGSYGHSCYQALPQWVIDAQTTADDKFDMEKWLRTETDGEDCLFLDVARPINITAKENGTLPVLVWIYGGGYVFGAKDMPAYTPAGLYTRAQNNSFIYVALNYRMGAFGFLAGPEFEDQGGKSNLGLYDQRLALQWIQDNIGKFGGDPRNVTVMGGSAGAGSIAHQMVWDDSTVIPKTPFKKAIIQSPAWVPSPGTSLGLTYQTISFFDFLDFLQVDALEEAKNLQEWELKDANRGVVLKSPYGTFTYGPVVDGSAIKAPPLSLFRQGKQNQSVEIFTGGVGAEGMPFVPIHTAPCIFSADWTVTELSNYIKNALPLIDPLTTDDILREYPDEGTACFLFTAPGISRRTRRLAKIAGEALVNCNARGISTASGNNTYNYIFSRVINTELGRIANISMLHGQDMPYTFYNKNTSSTDVVPYIAEQWQKYLMGFVLKSDPNFLNTTTKMAKYGSEGNVVQFDWANGTTLVKDSHKGKRCDEFWPRIWDAYGVEERGPEPGPPGPPGPEGPGPWEKEKEDLK
ncbi:hypothetical protein G7Y89_g13052 [Cudoniella acicularis]|uniref:Carboxylic ester hydrolase n=1 Tax=Cudoniella acicularis TaxID=354080 RepID=A0A8H4RBF9_9HELO|nr:hypothetical protein G7Y89_g13052 [Cudoniella acicularis]